MINLNVCPSFRGVGDEVLVKSGLAGKGFVAVAARQLWKDPDQLTINRCWSPLWTSFEFSAGLLPSSLTCSLQPWALFPRPLLRPGWFRTWQHPCWMSFGGPRRKETNLTCSLVFFSSPSVEHAFEMSIKNLLLSHFFCITSCQWCLSWWAFHQASGRGTCTLDLQEEGLSRIPEILKC